MSQASCPTPEALEIRGKPRPVRRFSKRALIILLAAASAVILGSLAFALQAPDRAKAASGRELYSTASKPTAEGLAALPASYGDVKPEAPELGPPLPGDLGGPILKARREGRMAFDEAYEAAPPDEKHTALQMREAERAAQAAAMSDAARGSGVFFSIGARRSGLSPAPETADDKRPSLQLPDLSAFANSASGVFGASLSEDPNRQERKLGFLGETDDTSIYNPHRLETPISPWQLMAGTVIPATLLTGVNSDLPGQVIAQVTRPVYDTVSGETVLVPQGARVIGRYDSVIAFGQSRALLVWTRFIMPDGTSIRIDNLAGVDARGYAGLEDKVDFHSWRLLQGVALSTLLGVGSELASDDEGDIARALRRSAQTGANQAGQDIVSRSLDVQPTITIRPGWRLGIIVNKDIVLKPYQAGEQP
jgi:type IV secretory pathway VirB10-like protein